MTMPHYARLAGRILARSEIEPVAPAAEDRARMIGALEAALRAKRTRARWRRGAYAVVAIAASFAAVGLGVRAMRAPAPSSLAATASPVAAPSVVAAPAAPVVIAHLGGNGANVVGTGDAHGASGARDTPLMDGEALAPGSRIVARRRGHAILAFSTGTRLTVEDGGDVTLVDGGPSSVVALAHGAMRADVPTLGEGERFVVRTSDAEVEVHGTSFRVAADGAPCAGASTRVEVYDGTLTVRHGGAESRVDAGSSWPAGCAAPSSLSHVSAPPLDAARRSPARVAVPSRAADAPAVVPVQGQAASAHSLPPRPALSPSSLAEQNDLFAGAVAARQAGNAPDAVERFEAFAARYPSSPLAESAAANRMKLLRGMDPSRAASAARAYLARWPDGFARSEAEGILTGAR